MDVRTAQGRKTARVRRDVIDPITSSNKKLSEFYQMVTVSLVCHSTLSSQLTPSESTWDNRTCVKKHGKRYPMTNIEAKISRLLLEACEELLPKTSAKNNKKINQALDLVREQLSSRKQS